MKRIALGVCALALSLAAAPAADGTGSKTEPVAGKIGWFEPVEREMEGWTVFVDPQLIDGEFKEEGDAALKMLANHLQRISILVPGEQLGKLRKVGIWVEHQHPELVPMQYHPEAGWLKEHGYHPGLAKKVHIPRADALLSRQYMLKQPAVILHELSHAYHDQVLGFEDSGILAAYEKAMDEGIYEKVLLFNGKRVQHYAATNHKEYFAESTEAYFYRNDFYPFVGAELKEHDPRMYAEMERVWGKVD